MCDAPSPEQLIKMKRREIVNLKSKNKILKEMIQMALNELGVPNEGYPAPVSNAVDILNQALKGEIVEIVG